MYTLSKQKQPKNGINWSEVKYPNIDKEGLELLEECKKRDAKSGKQFVKVDEKTYKLK